MDEIADAQDASLMGLGMLALLSTFLSFIMLVGNFIKFICSPGVMP